MHVTVVLLEVVVTKFSVLGSVLYSVHSGIKKIDLEQATRNATAFP
jgi:hypothetical protein